MGNFNKKPAFNKKRFDDRNERKKMFHAVCSNCGNDCEVPFKPMGNKPVLCNHCFGGKSNERSSFKKSDRGNYRQSSFQEKQMHQATCDECGKICEVPFKPTNDKPIYCSHCFEGQKSGGFAPKEANHSAEAFEALNQKLDKIIKILEILKPKREFIIEKESADESVAEKKKDKKEKPEVVKKSVRVDEKKASTKAKKKAPTKKVAPKKATATKKMATKKAAKTKKAAPKKAKK